MSVLTGILSVINPLIATLAAQYGVVGTILGYLLFVVAPLVSVLIEVAEAIVQLTETKDDDAVVSKIRTVYDSYVMPILEALPHVNLPLAPVIVKIVQIAQKVGDAAKAVVASLTGKSGQ